jgi:hypothetical protein
MTQTSNTAEDASVLDERPAKKPYQQPALTRWGSLRDLTMTVGQVGRPDWGYGRNRYTGRGGLHVLVTPKH